MPNLDDDVLITGGVIAAAWFLVVKPIMNTFGLSDEDKEAIDSTQNTPTGQNPFSPQYEPFVDNLSDILGDSSSIGTYMANLKATYDANYSDNGLTVNFVNPPQGYDLEIAKAAELINDAFSFHPFTLKAVTEGNRDGVEQIFYTVTSQYDVAAIAAYLWYNYNTDLWHILKNGGALYLYGLPGADLAAIAKRVQELPIK